ncbi:WhiB family transcriptional regulator [Nocardia amikacinitolerans]|uniref:WhiB family transcriptional regulator n=1 Tax=Nocardia amikacinitolerans TaxID=756689 RepID=UPI0020A4E63C|nr:WhiB family transcriptional regulator [Nocardia amikacinitolerans]MCP2293366.1 Transcription factor WhiB [Nocardia amikacinitolerans]
MTVRTSPTGAELTLADLLPLSDARGWHRAACRGDPNHEAWFPYPSQDFDYARSICASCPIRAACAEFAADTGQSGVWGGHEFDRGRMIRE